MIIQHETLNFETKGNKATYFEIRQQCLDFIKETGVKDGILVVQSPHTTCGVFFEEMVHVVDALGDDFLCRDLNKGLELVFPKQKTYSDYYAYPGTKHFEFGSLIPGSELTKTKAILLNADVHLKATLIGRDVTIIIKDGVLQTGKFGYIYFVDFDGNRARKRKCNLTVMGV